MGRSRTGTTPARRNVARSLWRVCKCVQVCLRFFGWRRAGGCRLDPSPALPCSRRGGSGARSKLAVIPFLEGIEQVRGAVHFAVVFDLFVALDLDHAAVL